MVTANHEVELIHRCQDLCDCTSHTPRKLALLPTWLASGNPNVSIRRCLAMVACVHISLLSFHDSSFWQSCDLHTTCPSSSNILDLAVALVVKNPPASAGDIRDVGLIPRSGRSPGEGRGSPLQYSFLENIIDRGAWQATVYRVAKSQTWLKRFRTHLQP